MNALEFRQYAKKFHIELTETQSRLLLADMAQVLTINATHNLTAIRSEGDFIHKHLIDSLLCDLSLFPDGAKILDIGTGGGFPGIPLAICYPQLEFTLMDATEKKIRAVESIVTALALPNVKCVSERAEVLAKDPLFREQYDGVVSRGVAAYSILAELCLPFVKPGGSFFAWKGPGYQKELEGAQGALECLKAKICRTEIKELFKTREIHVIIEAKKTGKTPKKYPRNYGTIKKKPL